MIGIRSGQFEMPGFHRISDGEQSSLRLVTRASSSSMAMAICTRPPALQAVAARARLTGAERHCASLAAAGHPNKQIAEMLHISVRTVESHLHHSFHKLGITRRAELAETLRLDGERLDGERLDAGSPAPAASPRRAP